MMDECRPLLHASVMMKLGTISQKDKAINEIDLFRWTLVFTLANVYNRVIDKYRFHDNALTRVIMDIQSLVQDVYVVIPFTGFYHDLKKNITLYTSLLK